MEQIIRNLMYPNPVTISADMSVSEALNLMREGNFRHLPVLKDGLPYSIVSEREIAMALSSSVDPTEAATKPISDFCAMDLVSVSSTATLISVLDELIEKKIGAVVVIEEQEFVGVFSVIDACQILRNNIDNASKIN